MNFIKATGNIDPGHALEAHHNLPQEFRVDFTKAGLNIDYPVHMSWWPKVTHQENAKIWNDVWREFFLKHPNPTQLDILDQMRILKNTYGLW